jgi:tetratricopeptide (TPR) repeat protein
MELLVSNYQLLEKSKFILGGCYTEIREKNLAQTEWYKKCELSSFFADSYGELGWVYQQLEQWYEAIYLMNRASEFNDLPKENLNTLYYNLGVCYEEIGDLKTAIKFLRKAIEINPNDKDALFNLGMFSGKLKHFSDATSFLEQYLKLDSESEKAETAGKAMEKGKEVLERQKEAAQLIESVKDKKIGDIINMSLNLVREKRSDLSVALLKKCVFRKEISMENRIMAHFCLAQALTIGWAPPEELKKILNQYEINEIYSNLLMSIYLYDHFLKDRTTIDNLRELRDDAKAKLEICAFKLGAAHKVGRGKWAKPSQLCPVFTDYEGYPEEYYYEV